MGTHLLLSLLALPLIGTVILLFIQENKTTVLKTITAIVTGLQLWIVIQLISNFDRTADYLQFIEHLNWIRLLKIDFFLGLNGINLSFLTISAVTFFVTAFINWKDQKRQKTFHVLLMLLNIGVTGLFLSFDLFLFTVFYGVTLFSTALLITLFSRQENGPNQGHFALYALISFCLITIGSIIVSNQNPDFGFNLVTLSRNSEALLGVQSAGFIIFLMAFLFITPLFPFHSWYLGIIDQTNTSLAVILLALISKISVFGILHIVIPLFPQSVRKFAIIFGILAVISVLYFALSVFSQKNYRRIVAYFTGYSNAYIFLGLSSILAIRFQNPGAVITGINGAIIQSFSSALVIIPLLLVPKVLFRANQQSPEAHPENWSARFLLIVILTAAIGLPGFVTFIGQFLCLTSAYQQLVTGIFTILAMTAMVFVGIQFFKIIRATIDRSMEYTFNLSESDITNENVIIPVILALLLSLGIFPQYLLNILRPSVIKLAEYISML